MDAIVEGPNFEFATETHEVRDCASLMFDVCMWVPTMFAMNRVDCIALMSMLRMRGKPSFVCGWVRQRCGESGSTFKQLEAIGISSHDPFVFRCEASDLDFL